MSEGHASHALWGLDPQDQRLDCTVHWIKSAHVNDFVNCMSFAAAHDAVATPHKIEL